MSLDIYIEDSVSKESLIKAFSAIMRVNTDDISFYEEPDGRKDNAVYDVAFYTYAHGFRTRLSIFTNHFSTYLEWYPHLQLLADSLSSRIFMDETETTGKLFSPYQENKDAKFDIDSHDDDFLLIIE